MFANEQEIKSLINAKNLDDMMNFTKQTKRFGSRARGEKGAIAIQYDDVEKCEANKNLKIKDLTGAGDLFAGFFLWLYK